MLTRNGVASVLLVFAAGICYGQSSEPRDGWLMQNYRFTGPPPAGERGTTDPALAQLQEIQNTTLAILRKANFAGDYEAALAAASQAVANAQLIGAILQHQQGPVARKTSTDGTKPKAVYLIALRDQTIQAATSYWIDAKMLHCITLEGAHEQIRLDLIDRKLSSELNQRRNVEFRLPAQVERSY